MLAGPQFRRGEGPRYLQVATLMRRRIEIGVWPPGTQIPTLDELVREYGLARMTIRQAIEILERDGLLTRRQGSGTFVAERLPDRRWLRLGGDWEGLLNMVEGLSPRLLTLEDSARQPRIHPDDGVPALAYKYMRRVHTRDDAPFCLIDIYLDQRVYRRSPRAFKSQTVLPLLATLGGVDIARARQTLTIGTADVETARQLDLPINAPIAEVRRIVAAADGTVVYLAELVYRGDVIMLDIDLLGKTAMEAGPTDQRRNR